ncbi:MAG: hypothetical protein ABW061_16910 [Polyangiaceae bacterium]
MDAFELVRHASAIAIPGTVIPFNLWSRREPAAPPYHSHWEAVLRLKLPARVELARGVFFKRLENYRALCAELDKNTYRWTIFIGLTIVVLSSKKPFSIESISLPPGGSHFVIIAVMLYMWMAFGAILKTSILERMALWKLVDAIEGPLPENGTVDIDSLRPLLHGKVILDVWFARLLPEYSLQRMSTRETGAVSLLMDRLALTVASLLVGVAHATAIVLAWDAARQWGHPPLIGAFMLGCQVALAALVVLCNLYFPSQGHGRGFFSICALGAALGIELLPLLKQVSG